MDRAKFFDEVRAHLFGGQLVQSQVDGVNAILDARDKYAQTMDPRELAYCLATTFHETARAMTPVREIGEGRGMAYGSTYYGRGLVQLTWERNYAMATARLRGHGVIDASVDLARDPDLALRPDIASAILIFGMSEGWFTGRKLSQFFAGTRSDWIDARRIINGHDRAALIAGYGLHFYSAITA